MSRMITQKLSLLLSLSLFALIANSTACIVVSDGDGGDWDEDHHSHYDEWEDWDDCRCDDWDGECGDEDHDGHDHDGDGHADHDPDDHDNTDPDGHDDPDTDPDGSDTDPDGGDGADPDAPEDCPQPEQVCGEDGQTYETACDASRAHVRVSHAGPCGEACLFDADCDDFEQCGAAGTCEPIVCTEEYEPVCGADGVTYDNACVAGAHHVSVTASGECAPACSVDTDCDLGSVCEGGYCEEANCPEVAMDDFSQEVCGADDFTYASACIARADHISIAHEGCCVE